jgi:hypothetical protein
MYPKPDRSNQIQNFVKSEENPVIDLGWSEGLFSDGRPYRVECWAEYQVTMLTFFCSTAGMENYSDLMFQELLSKEKLVQFASANPHVSAMSFTDASGNEMWSVNVAIGIEDELHAIDSTNLQAYERSTT